MTDSAKRSENPQPASWIQYATEKLVAKEWLAIFISGSGFLINALLAILCIGVSGISIWIALDARTEARVAQLELQAYIREQSQ